MVGMRAASLLMTVLLGLSLLSVFPTASAAPFADLTFTVVITDAQDNAGFIDLREIALAETGKQELVVRYKIDTSVPSGGQANLQQDFFFTSDGVDYSTGINAAGGAAGNGNYDVPAGAKCTLDGSYGYCVLPYAGFKGTVGSALTATSAISYAGSAQDYAPATGGWVPFGLIGDTGSDYTLKGCTAAVCPAVGGAVRVLNITTDALAFNFTHKAPDSNHTLLHWKNAHAVLQLSYHANVTKGGVSLVVRDSANKTVAARNLTTNATVTLAIDPAALGNWTVLVNTTAFQGSFGMILAAPPEAPKASLTGTTSASPSGSDSASGTPTERNSTGTKDTPFPALPTVAVGLGLALLAVRRRLSA